jgi:hypothetical protein
MLVEKGITMKRAKQDTSTPNKVSHHLELYTRIPAYDYHFEEENR